MNKFEIGDVVYYRKNNQVVKNTITEIKTVSDTKYEYYNGKPSNHENIVYFCGWSDEREYIGVNDPRYEEQTLSYTYKEAYMNLVKAIEDDFKRGSNVSAAIKVKDNADNIAKDIPLKENILPQSMRNKNQFKIGDRGYMMDNIGFGVNRKLPIKAMKLIKRVEQESEEFVIEYYVDDINSKYNKIWREKIAENKSTRTNLFKTKEEVMAALQQKAESYASCLMNNAPEDFDVEISIETKEGYIFEREDPCETNYSNDYTYEHEYDGVSFLIGGAVLIILVCFLIFPEARLAVRLFVELLIGFFNSLVKILLPK